MSASTTTPTSNAVTSNSGNKTADPNKKVKIGFAMDTLKEERWVRDREAFEAHCAKMNVECVITVADIGLSAADEDAPPRAQSVGT